METLTTLEVKENIADCIITDGDTISEAINRSFTLQAWFKAYIVSKEFSELEQEFKEGAFETYTSLLMLLDTLDRKLAESSLGVYKH